MLRQLDVRDGMRILEIGTGTGWNAALLAHRLGDRNVVSVEIDPQVAEQACRALAAAGRHPLVATGDGADGYAAGAPYDRVIATCAVQHVPYAWVEQTRPDGLVLSPWGTALDNGYLLHLSVHNDRTATGRFGDEVGFMWMRGQRIPYGYLEDRVWNRDQPDRSMSPLWPGKVFTDRHATFAAGLLVPGCRRLLVTDEADSDGAPRRQTLWVHTVERGSWPSVTIDMDADDPSSFPVAQFGSRRLWDEVESAYDWWDQAGRPDLARFGLTVTRDRQWVWLDSPDQPVPP